MQRGAWWRIAPLMLALPQAGAGVEREGGIAAVGSPLRWTSQASGLREDVPSSALRQVGHVALGEELFAQVGVFGDAHPFAGPAAERDAYLVRTTLVVATIGADAHVPVPVDLWFDMEWALIAASTRPRSHITTKYAPEMLELEFLKKARSVAPLSPQTSLKSTVSDVLGELWKHHVPLSGGGVVVLRPRAYEFKSAAVDETEATWADDAAHPAWIVEVLGAGVRYHGLRKSRVVLALQDGVLGRFEGLYLP